MKDALDAPRAATAARPLQVLVTSYRSHPHVGGQGVYVRELSRALAGLGCAVSVASGPPYPELDAGVELIRLPSLDLFAEDNAFLALRPRHLADPAALREWIAHNTGAFAEMSAFALRLERFLARSGRRFDVIHDNQTLAPALARIARRTPVVTTLHHPIEIDRGFALAGAQGLKAKLFTRRWYGFTRVQAEAAKALPAFLAVSHAARDAYARLCGVDPGRIAVAHNGLDHAVFRPDPGVVREPALLVAAASADVPIKGLDVIIEALARLGPEHEGARLVVIGSLRDGPTKRAIDAAGLGDRVSFRSGLTREAIADLHRRATVFVSASRFEGFGFPAAEAMACGAPVVVSDGGALPEVVGEAGVVTPAGDADALAVALGALLKDPGRRARLSQGGIARARAAFSWTRHAEAALALYGAPPEAAAAAAE